MNKKFDLEFFDFFMKDESLRTYICHLLANDKSMKSTILLDCHTYLDDIDLSFEIQMYIAYDKHDSYFIIGVGEEYPSVFHYFQQKIIKQIVQFNDQAKVYCLYIDTLHSAPEDIKV